MLGTLVKSGKKARGFSIIEIVIAMALAAGIVVGIMLMIRAFRGDIKLSEAATQLQNIAVKLDTYEARNGHYPSTAEGLEATAIGMNEQDRKKMLEDPWGSPLNYAYPGTKNPDSYDLFSSGEDKIPNTVDDIWKK